MLMFSMPKTKTEEEFAIDFLLSEVAQQLWPDYEFIRELDTPFGIPDVVLFKSSLRADIQWLQDRFQLDHYSPSYARVISSLNKRSSVSAATLVVRTGLSANYLLKVTNELGSHGIITQTKKGYLLSKEVKLPGNDYISIEFKLSDWRKALTQASRHTAFAKNCWVVMPENKYKLLKERSNQFSKHGVSVATYDPDSKQVKRVVAVRPKSAKSHYSSLDIVNRIARNSHNINQVALA